MIFFVGHERVIGAPGEKQGAANSKGNGESHGFWVLAVGGRQTLGKVIARLHLGFHLRWVLHTTTFVGFAGAADYCKQNNGKKHGFHRGKVYLHFSGATSQSRKNQILEGKSAPVKIRTSNLLIRSQMLYPVELRVLKERLICGEEGAVK